MLKHKIQEFQNALNNFKQSLSINLDEYSVTVQDSIKSGQIQKFEFCVELY